MSVIMSDVYQQWIGREVVVQLREPVAEGSPEGFVGIRVPTPKGEEVTQPKLTQVIVGTLRVLAEGDGVVYQIESTFDPRRKITYLVPRDLVLVMHRVDETNLIVP